MWTSHLLFAIASIVVASFPYQTDFSGRWILTDVIDNSTGRGGAAGPPGAPKVSDVKGTLVNCADECTIVQTATTLTVSRPADKSGVVSPPVVTNLDGQPMAGRSVTVKWDGPALILIRRIPGVTITQTLKLNDGSLTLHDEFSSSDLPPITLNYKRAPS